MLGFGSSHTQSLLIFQFPALWIRQLSGVRAQSRHPRHFELKVDTHAIFTWIESTLLVAVKILESVKILENLQFTVSTMS